MACYPCFKHALKFPKEDQCGWCRIAELEAENKRMKKRQDIFEKELRETWDYEDSHINELLEVKGE